MLLNDKNIKAALHKGERVTLECKRAKSEVPKSVWETYSAFANTMGGLILLGVEERPNEKNHTKRFEIVGVEDSQKILTDFWNTINSNKVSQNILKDSDVEVVGIDGKQVVCIRVPMADWREKPIYLNDNVLKGSFRRNHEGDYHCAENQVKAMIRDANEDGNDGLLMRHYGMEDVDDESLRQYRTEFRIENRDHVWNKCDDKIFLKNFGAYTIDKETGEEGLTLAGLLMFGTGLAVRERLSNFRMDYVDMSHLVGDERYHDRLTYDGRWENNIYQFLNRVLPKLTIDLPRPFRMEGVKRIDDTPQHKAVREAFTNAVIHADVFLSGGILRIDKYDDKFVLRNPGTLRLPVEKIYEGGTSRARNPRIQNMLRMIGYGENLGSGFPMIVSAWKEAGFNEPLLENRVDLDEVALTLPIDITRLDTEKGIQKNAQENAQKNTQKSTQKSTQKKILACIIENPYITTQEMAEEIGVVRRTVAKYIKTLQIQGVIYRVGSDKGGRWGVIKDKKDITVAEPKGLSKVPNVSMENIAQKSTQKKILACIIENPYITTQEMAEEIGVVRRTIAKYIKTLQIQGVIHRVGPDKGGCWEVIKDEKDIAVAEPTRLSDELSKASERLSKELSETAKKILMLIIADNDVSRKELAEKTGISTNAVQKHLNKLKALGFIRRTGSARYGYWEVKEHKL